MRLHAVLYEFSEKMYKSSCKIKKAMLQYNKSQRFSLSVLCAQDSARPAARSGPNLLWRYDMARTGRFVIKKVGDGYMFELQASNYSAIAESPVYTTLDSAKRSIRSIMENAHSVPVQDNTVEEQLKYPNPKFEVFRNGEYYFFRFRAGNGKMTISSQVYTSKEGCKNGVASVQNHVQDSVICIETAEGIVSLEEYAEMDDKTLADGQDPTILEPIDEEELPEEERATRPGRFMIYQDGKTFRFELLAANFSSIADSPSYSTLDSVKRSIRSLKEYACNVPVQDNTVDPVEKQSNPKFEIYRNEDGTFIFRFRAKNGKQTIASQQYASKDGCRNGVESVQKHIARAEVYIETDEGPMPIEEYTAIRVAIFNASVFRKSVTADGAADTTETLVPMEEAVLETEETQTEAAPIEAKPAAASTEEAHADATPTEEAAPAEEAIQEATEEAAEEATAEAVEETPAEAVAVEEASTVEEVADEAQEKPATGEEQAASAPVTGTAAKKRGFGHFLARALFGSKK